ncbi:helix-turn-helix domain-containing protein [Roseivivax sediminis]|uniref:AraC-type DNA-binding protein n=1 Tax=Roseivivax sediminis TaxID=936889 RepID=A0A1I1SZ96_9RHOB|nr:AraC family transcriptional regulator [Roseivivax sediminis]SFD51692.1 AraC-type DNA-binding protein [Roseivivax sediminis]
MPNDQISSNTTISRGTWLPSQLDIPFMSVGRLRERIGAPTRRIVGEGEPGVLVLVELGQRPRHGLRASQTAATFEICPKANVSIRDVRHACIVDDTGGADTVLFWIGSNALSDFSMLSGRPEFTALRCVQGVSDPWLQGLALALLPALERPGKSSPLFLEQLALAVMAHLTQCYGGMTVAPTRKGGLSARQETTAVEFLAAHLQEEFTLQDLADACGLSRSYFSKAFKATFGKTPGRWLAEFRVARACELLRTTMPISQISFACGFADQSHLTRVFSEIMGEPPGGWRRSLREISHDGHEPAGLPSNATERDNTRADPKVIRALRRHRSTALARLPLETPHPKPMPPAVVS